MKKHARMLTAALLACTMAVSTVTPASLAAPGNTGDAESTDSSVEFSLSSTAETNLASARILASLTAGEEDTGTQSKAKSAVTNAIFNGYNDTTDLSDYNISSEKMDSLIKEILEEKNMTSAVDVTYETDSEGTVTTAEVEMDPMVTMAAEELEENQTVYGLTDEQSQELLGMYAQYIQLCEENADMFGVQVPYNTTRDTNASPIGSLLDVAGISEEYAQAGYVGYDVLSGIIQLYYLGTSFAIEEYKDDVIAKRDEALKVLDDDMTDMQKYLALNDWLAANCNFSMEYIMEEMVEPEPAERELYTYAYNCMKQTIYNQVYDATLEALKATGMDDATAEQYATAQADAFMVDVQEENGSGEQQAASTASSIVGLWGSNQVGALVEGKAVCFGYATTFAYLLQCANPDIYLKSGKTDLDTAENWKSYEELNYALDEDGNPKKDDNGNYVWSENSAAIVDYVKIIFDTEVTMFGQESGFGECHYWNAVKLDGKWYYVDPCYVDIYVECMNRDRVETDGNLNHLYFMFSDDSCREMYEDNYKEIRTLYEGIATDTTYEEAWVAFVKSQPYWVGDRVYYLYDSTDMLDIMRNYGNGGTGSNSRAASDDITDYEGLFTDTEYKVVYHDNANAADTDDSFVTLIDFNNGQVYDPDTNAMEDNGLIAMLYEEHQEYIQEYPSISISTAYYDGKIYFSLSNCILSYTISTGAVEKLIEYTEVSGERDMSKGLGGMGFTMTSDDPGTNGITVENPPIADMTIKADGKMYVSVATDYAFISGKDFGQLTDYSSYGYQFAETNYNPSYNSYYNNEEANDNDEFMWSANIVGTIDMDHLTGSSHSNTTVTVPASCTEAKHDVTRCSTCGKISSEDVEGTNAIQTAALNIEVKASDAEDAQTLVSATLTASGEAGESNTFKASDIKAAVEKSSLPSGYTLTADYTDIEVAYGFSKTLTLTAAAGENAAAVAVLNIEVKASDDEDAQVLASTTLTKVKETSAAAARVAETEEETTTKAAEETTTEAAEETTTQAAEETTTEAAEETTTKAAEETTTEAAEETTTKAAEEPVSEESASQKPAPQEASQEAPAEVTDTADTLNADEDTTPVFSADEIKDAVAAFDVDGYTMPEYSGDSVEVAYGSSESVSLAAEKETAGSGHRYVKFDETYYTKDDNGNWQTGTSYACVDCGHAFELDEDDETVEDNLKKNDTQITDDQIASWKSNQTKVWTWSTDATEASMYLVPTDMMEHKFDCIWENTAFSSRAVAEVSGDCETGKFNATVTIDGTQYTETKDVGAGSHSYLNQEEKDDAGNVTQEAAVQWSWNDDCTEATASLTCDVCGETITKTVSRDDMEASDTEATCTEAGSVTYTATVTVDNVNYISSRTVETDAATGHTYGEPEWNWADPDDEGRYTAATAVFKCSVCDTEETVEAEITRAVDRSAGTTTFTATVTFNDKEYTDTKTVDKVFKEDENPFEDVSEDDYYYESVMWAVRKNITTGIDETHFAPKENCTRAQVVTFLWRTMGEPETTLTENPFVDVADDAYYTTAVLWAYENGITTGMDETHFNPDDDVTRGQFVTFLYRQKGEPEHGSENPFVDVPEDEYYTDAVLWAYENGITTGIDETHFAPEDTCIRADVVTFLYRAYGEE